MRFIIFFPPLPLSPRLLSPSLPFSPQGVVGNCWLVCALSVLAESPEAIKRIILTKEYNPAGAYQVRLCRSGEWHTITVDDTFPTIGHDFLSYLKAARYDPYLI